MRLIIFASLIFGLMFSTLARAQNPLFGLMDLHNQYRQTLELEEIQWSDDLAAQAQQWAATLAFTNQPGPSGDGQGENIWYGQANSATLEDIFNQWIAEQTSFIAGEPVPQNCSASWENCEHYSQIVWAQTTQIGCAMATNDEQDYLVCQYDPPGNIQGQSAY